MAAAPADSGGGGMYHGNKVLVRGYGDMSIETLELFLESPRYYGAQGPVSNITMDTETEVATVTFEDANGTAVTPL